MMVLAHLSDVHLGPLPGFRLRDVRVKRMIGYINWRRNRQETHRAATLSKIIADVQAQNPDHVAITGDLVNLGLPGEIRQAADWLAGLGDPERYTVVPGNHDTYVHMLRDAGITRWWGHMRSNAAGRPFCHGTGPFPFVRVVGDVALVGVSSAVPTLPIIATGQVGAAQLEATGKTLQALDEAGLARVVLIHHPPLPGQTKAIRRLRDAKLFRDLIAQFGAELIVHGHDHKQSLFWAKGPNGPVPVVGVASASAIHQDRPCRARYNLFQIAGSPGGWQIEMTGRGLIDGTGEKIGQLDHMVLSPT